MSHTKVACRIAQRQSTYWDFEDRSGVRRVHFLDKQEFRFSSAVVDGFLITDDHPLLLDYRAAWKSVYVSTRADDPRSIVSSLVEAFEPLTQGWRSAYAYLTSTDPVRMLGEGFGQLLHAPDPIASVAADVLLAAGVAFTVLPGQPARWPCQALIAGDNYVIAAGFRIESLSSPR